MGLLGGGRRGTAQCETSSACRHEPTGARSEKRGEEQGGIIPGIKVSVTGKGKLTI